MTGSSETVIVYLDLAPYYHQNSVKKRVKCVSVLWSSIFLGTSSSPDIALFDMDGYHDNGEI